MIKDPVCGMPAEDCQAKFVREPARYAVQAGEREQQTGQA